MATPPVLQIVVNLDEQGRLGVNGRHVQEGPTWLKKALAGALMSYANLIISQIEDENTARVVVANDADVAAMRRG